MDVLSDVLSKIRLRSVFYFNHLFAKPWGMHVDHGANAQFHIVLSGSCVIKFEGKVTKINPGGIVLFPKGSSHIISDGSTKDLRNGIDVVNEVISNPISSEQGETRLVCGHFEFDQDFNHPLIKDLPEIILLDQLKSNEMTNLKSILQIIHFETSNRYYGSDAVITKLGEVLFVQVLREYIEGEGSNFLHAVRDKRLGEVLKEIHKSPNSNWTLNALAKVAGMSRTGFLQKFKTSVGDTPYNYIKGWRIILAKELLRSSDYTIQQVAEKVGYESSASFVRAFKESTEITPHRYRKGMVMN